MPLLPRLILGMPLILIVPVVGMSQITSTQILGWLNPTTTLLGSVHWDIKWVTGHPSHCRSNHIIQGSPIVTPHLPCHFTLFLSPFTFFKCLLLSKKILYQMILVRTTSGKMKTHLHPSSLEMSPLAPMVSSKVLAPCLWQCLLLVFLILLVFCRTPLPISHLTSFCSTACSQDMWVWSTSLSTSPPSSVSYEFIMYPLLTDTLTASPVAPVASPSGSSLHPCDLASQLSSPGGKMPPPLPPDQPSNCPDHYPQAILWWFDIWWPQDRPQYSHLPWQQTIQHMDGALITADEWKTIHELAVTVASTCLHCLSIRHLPPSAAQQPWKMAFYHYQHYFIKEWHWAIREWEVVAPLLSYCGGIWKGEKTLACIMQDMSSPPEPPSHPLLCLLSHSCPASSLSHSHSHTLTPGLAPPSTVNSSIADPSNSAPSSYSAQVLPCCAALTLAVWPHPWPVVPVIMSKVVKAKCRCKSSPSWLDKWPRGSEDVTSLSNPGKDPPPPCLRLIECIFLEPAHESGLSSSAHPPFLAIVQADRASSLVHFPILMWRSLTYLQLSLPGFTKQAHTCCRTRCCILLQNTCQGHMKGCINMMGQGQLLHTRWSSINIASWGLHCHGAGGACVFH